MKKYYFTNLGDTARYLLMAADEKSATVITIGTKTFENQMMAQFRSNTANRQIVLRAVCEKTKETPEEAIQLVVKTKAFCDVIQTLSCYKDAKVFLQVGEKDVTIGVDTKAKIKLELLAETPQEVKSGTFLAKFIADEKFEPFLRKGCGCASQSIDQARLLHNTVLVLNTLTGDLSALSTDGYSMARAKTKVLMAKAKEGAVEAEKAIEAMKKNLEAFCEGDEKQSVEAFTLCVPTESMHIIRQVIAGVKNVGIAADDKHLVIQAGVDRLLTVTRGTGTSINCAQMDTIFAQQGDVSLAMDAETFIRGVTLCNKVVGMNGGKEALVIEVAKDAVKLSVGEGSKKLAETKIPMLGKSGETVKVNVSGKKLEALLSMLDKGGVVIRFAGQKLMLLANGNLTDGTDDTANMALALIRPKEEAETDPEEEEVSEGMEAQTEGTKAA